MKQKLYVIKQKDWELTEPINSFLAEQEKNKLSSLFSDLKVEEVVYG